MAEQVFPTIRYHATQPSCVVENAEAMEALGEGWQDHPYTNEEREAYHASARAKEPIRQGPQSGGSVDPQRRSH